MRLDPCHFTVDPPACFAETYAWHDWQRWYYGDDGLFALVGLGLIGFFVGYPLLIFLRAKFTRPC